MTSQVHAVGETDGENERDRQKKGKEGGNSSGSDSQ